MPFQEFLQRLPPPDAEFCYPVEGLYADFEGGTGTLCLTDDFADLNSVVQLRIMKGWGEALAQQQTAALQRLFAAFGHAGLPHDERVAKFARHCAWSGIEISPAAMAML